MCRERSERRADTKGSWRCGDGGGKVVVLCVCSVGMVRRGGGGI